MSTGEILQWIATASLGVLGVLGVLGNLLNPLLAGKPVSLVPLVAGVSLSAALLIFPDIDFGWLAWIPLVIDPGCLLFLTLFGYHAIVGVNFSTEQENSR